MRAEYKKYPTEKELIAAVDNVLKQEHDANTRLRFFFGLLKVFEKNPQRFRDALLERIEKILVS